MMTKPNKAKARVGWPPVGRILAAYAIPLGFLAAPFILLVDLGFWILLRNFTRAASGPLLHVGRVFGLGINALWPYALFAVTFWMAWLALVILTPLKRMPFIFHLLFGAGWCFYGFFKTLAI
jgi:hypothetical protein